MKQYKGVYIDGTIFTSEQDVDKFLEAKAVESYRIACQIFAKDRSIEASIYADEKAAVLLDTFGYTWEQVEAIEISAIA